MSTPETYTFHTHVNLTNSHLPSILPSRLYGKAFVGKLAADIGIPFIETSSKDAWNVEEAFTGIAKRVNGGR
eukprot:37688-Eustigmatos_ZCMA.PRE.1